MKYLLNYLEGIQDAPDLSNPDFKQLLTDVQASKSQVRSSDAFFEALEKIVNELKTSPESVAFHKPVSKREAPNYYDIILHPMDLTTIARNAKAHKYKSKAEFAADLDLIWDNCLNYNTQENHPLRAAARFMKQKADHHLEFLADRNDKSSSQLIARTQPSKRGGSTRAASQVPGAGGDEDAAGESDDAIGEGEEDFQQGAEGRSKLANGASRPDESQVGPNVDHERAASVTVVGQARPKSPPPFRPKLQTSLQNAPLLARTPHSMSQFQLLSSPFDQPGPSFSDKGKAKEILYATPPPPWYCSNADEEEAKLEGGWWGYASRDESYTSGLPSVPIMASSAGIGRKRRRIQPKPPVRNGVMATSSTTTLVDEASQKDAPRRHAKAKPINLEDVIHRSVDKLFDARQAVNRIQEWQKIEMEGGVLPPRVNENVVAKRAEEEERVRRTRRKVESGHAKKRRKLGGEVGEEEAALGMKKATAAMLAHAGFEGANEIALDMCSRVVVDHLHNLGRTFRLFLDGFSHKMTNEEIVLHSLYENGQIPVDLETHIKDEIEREESKINDIDRRMKQAYEEVTTAPVIEDDMMFADHGEMLTDGNFAEELGEDFLGLRELGIDREFGLNSLTVPSSLFYGRRKRQAGAGSGTKEPELDYPPPPPLVPLSAATLNTHLPALFHAFFSARIESGLGLADDEFDAAHSQIGSLGQIVVKNMGQQGVKKKKVVEGNVEKEKEKVEKKKKVPKVVQPGVGKGNWIRPSKEERDRRAAEKKAALLAMQQAQAANANGRPSEKEGAAAGEEDDAEGEEEE